MIVQRALDHGPQPRIVVPEKDRPEGAVEVDVLVAVHIPHPRAQGLGDVDGIGIGHAPLAHDAARHQLARPLVEPSGAGMGNRPVAVVFRGVARVHSFVLLSAGTVGRPASSSGGPFPCTGRGGSASPDRHPSMRAHADPGIVGTVPRDRRA